MNKLKTLNVINIFELGFQLHETPDLNKKENSKDLVLDFNIGLDIKDEGKIVGITINSTFHLKKDKTKVVASSKVKTEFQLTYENEVKLEDDGKLNLPDQHWITMLSLAISHARALMARSTNGTIHHNLILPIVNPSEIFKNTLKQQ
ncbi:hypothetical protein QYS49_31565 [Marivirga salinae]|uniref:Preprotein translocase subunit SecB n=1 Tax=Marivirga salinarum TaxID=3059078 RepID=A0AA49JBM9_9BACT|nr:hypothetical protein [Marivirga sp. BDSF4-3]WKK75899.2 hypothetical protein QYS49_31565 [Marivirga sp. BDSF4-3]